MSLFPHLDHLDHLDHLERRLPFFHFFTLPYLSYPLQRMRSSLLYIFYDDITIKKKVTKLANDDLSL
jgi:hypothetical protein